MISINSYLYSEVLNVIFLVSLLLLFLLQINSNEIKKFLISIFFSHSFLNIAKYNVIGLYSDEKTYYSLATSLAQDFGNIPINYSKSSIVIISSLLIRIFGNSPIYILIFNSFIFVCCVYFIIKIRQFYFTSIALSKSDYIVLFFPQIIFFSLGINRENISYLTLVILVYIGFQIIYRFKFLYFIYFVPVIIIQSFTRIHLIIISLSFIFLLIFLKIRQFYKKWALIYLIIASTFTSVFIYFIFNKFIDISFVSLIDGNKSTSNTLEVSKTSWALNSSFNGFALNLLRSLFGPFIFEWEIPIWKWIILSTDGLIFLILFAYTIYHLRMFTNPILLYLCLIPQISWIVLNTIALSNYGLNIRMKSHLLIIFIILISYIMTVRRLDDNVKTSY